MQSKSFCSKNVNKSTSFVKKSNISTENHEDNKKGNTNNNLNQKSFKRQNMMTSRSLSSINQNKQNQKLNKKNKCKKQQLLQTIQIFHQTLTTFPLDRLILSERPHQWIQQQSITLFKLKQKMDNYKHIQSYQYYLAKLDSIQGIIKNIKNNLAMLTKMSTLNSIPSEQISSKGKSSFATSQLQQVSKNSSYKRSKNNQDKQNLMKLANSENNNENYNLIQENQQMILRSASFTNINYNNGNNFQTLYSQQQSEEAKQIFQRRNHFIAKSNKLSQKQQKSVGSNLQETKLIDGKKTMRKNKILTQTIQLVDNKPMNQTSSYQWVGSGLSYKPSQAETKRIQYKNQQIVQNAQFNTLKEEMKNKYSQQIKNIIQQFKNKEMHYLQQIYEFRQAISKKDQSIKQLLIQDQGYQQKIQALQAIQNQHKKQSLIFLNRISSLQKSNLQLLEEIKLYKNRQAQLRQTVTLQRQRTKSFIEKQKVTQVQIEEKDMIKKQLQLKIQNLNQQLNNQNKKLRKIQEENQILKQKQQIYRIKYFRTKTQLQGLKNKIQKQSLIWKKICIKCKQQLETSPRKNDENKQLNEIILFHKKKLLSSIIQN